MASQVRHFPFSRDRLGRPFSNPVLPSLKSFRRHLVTHHDCRLALGSRYGTSDQYVMLTPAEAARMRRFSQVGAVGLLWSDSTWQRSMERNAAVLVHDVTSRCPLPQDQLHRLPCRSTYCSPWRHLYRSLCRRLQRRSSHCFISDRQRWPTSVPISSWLGRSALCRRRQLCRAYRQATWLLTSRLSPCRRAGLPTTPSSESLEMLRPANWLTTCRTSRLFAR